MRTNKLSILLGNRATGKTIYGKSLIRAALKSGKAVLVIDTFDHPAYAALQRISPESIADIKPGECVRCYGSDIEMILHGCTNLYNALLVMEDATKYIYCTITDDVKQILFDSKQKNVDVLMMFHSWTACPPAVFRVADNLIIKKTGDNCEVRKKDCPNFAEVLKAWETVEHSADKYITKCVKLQ